MKNIIKVIGLVIIIFFAFMLYSQPADDPDSDMALWHDIDEKAQKQMSRAKKTIKEAMEKTGSHDRQNKSHLTDIFEKKVSAKTGKETGQYPEIKQKGIDKKIDIFKPAEKSDNGPTDQEDRAITKEVIFAMPDKVIIKKETKNSLSLTPAETAKINRIYKEANEILLNRGGS